MQEITVRHFLLTNEQSFWLLFWRLNKNKNNFLHLATFITNYLGRDKNNGWDLENMSHLWAKWKSLLKTNNYQWICHYPFFSKIHIWYSIPNIEHIYNNNEILKFGSISKFEKEREVCLMLIALSMVRR